jgi:hypothetical protein
MKEEKGIIHRGEGAYLRCPYMCVRGEITGDNVYRDQSVCPEGYNDFDFLKETK